MILQGNWIVFFNETVYLQKYVLFKHFADHDRHTPSPRYVSGRCPKTFTLEVGMQAHTYGHGIMLVVNYI